MNGSNVTQPPPNCGYSQVSYTPGAIAKTMAQATQASDASQTMTVSIQVGAQVTEDQLQALMAAVSVAVDGLDVTVRVA